MSYNPNPIISSNIVNAANRYGVPPELALSMVARESSFDPNAISREGAIGLTQLMPRTARGLGVDPWNVNENIDGGVRYLRQMYDRFGDWQTALWAYNAGPTKVERGKIPAGTKSYASQILDRMGQFVGFVRQGEGEGQPFVSDVSGDAELELQQQQYEQLPELASVGINGGEDILVGVGLVVGALIVGWWVGR